MSRIFLLCQSGRSDFRQSSQTRIGNFQPTNPKKSEYHHLSDNVPTMIMCHGNAEDIGYYHVPSISELFGINLCTFDYAGYGLHFEHSPSEDACFKDVLKHLRPNKLIIYGRSLRTGIACYFAHKMCKHCQKKRLT